MAKVSQEEIREIARSLGMKEREIVKVRSVDGHLEVLVFDGTELVITPSAEGDAPKVFIKGGDPATSKLPVWVDPVVPDEDDDEDDEEGEVVAENDDAKTPQPASSGVDVPGSQPGKPATGKPGAAAKKAAVRKDVVEIGTDPDVDA